MKTVRFLALAISLATLTQESYGRLIPDEVPSHLSVGRFEVLQTQRAMTRVNTCNDFDPLDVPNTVMEILCDGRS